MFRSQPLHLTPGSHTSFLRPWLPSRSTIVLSRPSAATGPGGLRDRLGPAREGIMHLPRHPVLSLRRGADGHGGVFL